MPDFYLINKSSSALSALFTIKLNEKYFNLHPWCWQIALIIFSVMFPLRHLTQKNLLGLALIRPSVIETTYLSHTSTDIGDSHCKEKSLLVCSLKNLTRIPRTPEYQSPATPSVAPLERPRTSGPTGTRGLAPVPVLQD